MYTVLAITCHPDDMEICCAGTLLKCKERGDRVVVCHLCSGNLGHVVIPPDELKVMRAKEAERSAAMAGFEIIHSEFDDLDIYYDNKEARDKVVDIIKQVNPDFIITHAPNDYMLDHTATSKLAFSASFAASCPHYERELGEATAVTPIFYMESADVVDSEPDFYVDITDELETKLDMLACHESQIVWLREHDNVDILEKTRIVAAFRGFQSGVKYAEGFRRCNTGLRNTTKRLLP